MSAFIASFLFVVLAEMGDKTQLLAMAFAMKYGAVRVLIAVFFASIMSHGLAVLVGHFLTTVVPLDIISFLAALSFIFFGLWTIHGDELHGEDKKDMHWGPIFTVAIAFFLAEMGDKTQLATISLAVQYRNMGHVLMGTTLGMVVANAFGIMMGLMMRRHISERSIKFVSAGVFIIFGMIGIYKVLSTQISVSYVGSILLVVGVVVSYIIRLLLREKK